MESGQADFVCDCCGARSRNAVGFKRLGGFFRARGHRCRACAELAQLDEWRRDLNRLALGAAVAVAVVLVSEPGSGLVSIPGHFGFMYLNLVVLTAPMAVLVTLVHELAHALAARWVGFEVFLVRLGVGPRLVRRRWGGIDVDIHAAPLGGVTISSTRDPRWFRLRRAVVVAAGPLTHVAWIALALGLMHAGDVGALRVGDGIRPLAPLLLVNGILLLASLLPYVSQGQPSDGANLLWLLFGGAQRPGGEYWMLGALRALEARDAATALALAEEGIELHPDDVLLRITRVDALACDGRWLDAEREIRAVLDRDLAEQERGLALADLAWVLRVSTGAERGSEADESSLDAMQILGDLGVVQAIRGGVLAASDRPAEAWPLLSNALAQIHEDRVRAIVSCDLARAAHALGRRELARRHIEVARQADASCVLLAETVTQLEGPAPPAPEDAGTPEVPSRLGDARRPHPRIRRRRGAVVALVMLGVFAYWTRSVAGHLIEGSLYLAGMQRSLPLDEIGTPVEGGSAAGEPAPSKVTFSSQWLYRDADPAGCAETVGQLRRWQPLLRWAVGGESDWLGQSATQRADFEECAGDVTAARASRLEGIGALRAWGGERVASDAGVGDGDPMRWTAAPSTSYFEIELARFEARNGNGPAAEEILRSALALATEQATSDGPEDAAFGLDPRVPLERALARLLSEQGRQGEARSVLEASAARLRASDPKHYELQTLLPLLIALLHDLGDEGRATDAERELGMLVAAARSGGY